MSKNTITINGMEITYGTREELADIMAVMGMSTSAKGKGKKPTSAKAPKPKADKPTTRREALAKWQAEKGITDESKAKYKALVNSNSDFYKGLWATREADKTYQANCKKFGKSFANKEFHKHICALASEESKK